MKAYVGCFCLSAVSLLPWFCLDHGRDLMFFLKGFFSGCLVFALVLESQNRPAKSGDADLKVELKFLLELGNEKMTFGKYKDVRMKDVPHGYFRWMEEMGMMKRYKVVGAYWEKLNS